jgi:hypothetical protein
MATFRVFTQVQRRISSMEGNVGASSRATPLLTVTQRSDTAMNVASREYSVRAFNWDISQPMTLLLLVNSWGGEARR